MVRRCYLFPAPSFPNRAGMTTPSSTAPSSYQDPPWAHDPSAREWKLIEIKGGVQVGQHELKKACTVLGRSSPDIVDIELSHPSCSRRHARIAFDKGGFPWLRDLQSTHGTVVNKRPIPKEAVGKQESLSTKRGARGVVLYVGDVLQFGASTRIYTVEGPSEYERGNVRAKQLVSTASAAGVLSNSTTTMTGSLSTANKSADESQDHASGVSWGIDMNDSMNLEDESINNSTVDSMLETFRSDPSKVPKIHHKTLERLNARKYKLRNLQQESERIRRKGEDLTHGQTQRLAQIEELQAKLVGEIESIEQQVTDETSRGTASTSLGRGRRRTHEDDDDVDDFYDKTIARKSREKKHDEAESEETLTAKWKEQYQLLKRVTEEWKKHEKEAQRIKLRLKGAEEDDAFFVQNELSLAQEQCDKAVTEMKLVEKDMDQTERWLRIVNDKLVFDRSSGYAGLPSMLPPPSGMMNPPPPRALSSMPPPPNMQMTPPIQGSERRSLPRSPLESDSTEKDMLPPAAPKNPGNEGFVQPLKKSRIMGPSRPPETPSTTTSATKKPSRHMAMRTLTGLSAAAQGQRTASKETSQQGETPRDETTKSTKPIGVVVDLKKDEWHAPAGQDGSGMTKLNEKFKGRY